jgi:hypothetical protein
MQEAMLQHMRTGETEPLDSVTTKRYAPPESTATTEQPPRPVGLVGFFLYLVFAAATIAAALEVFSLGGTLEADTIFLGGIVGAYTSGRYYRSRWLGCGVGLVATFLATGFAIHVRHAIGIF